MKAMIFAAGLGTRLRPLTDSIPKALVLVAGKPLLAHTIETLAAAGAEQVVVNVHHFASQVEQYLAQHAWPIRVDMSRETDRLLDTGGGMRRAFASYYANEKQPILVHNVDVLTRGISLRHFFQDCLISSESTATADRYKGNPPLAWLLVSSRPTSRYLLFHPVSNRLMGWTNVDTGQVRSPYPIAELKKCRRLAFAGIHMASTRILPLMSKWPERFSIIEFYLSICRQANIQGYISEDLQLLDVGKPAALASASQFLAGN